MSERNSIGRRLPRRLRQGVVTLLVGVLLLLSTLYWVVGTESGTRFGIHRFLEWYSGIIPGEIAVEEINGTVLDGLRFEKVSLRDRQRHPIITADKVHVRLTPARLIDGELHAPDVGVEGAGLYIRSYDGESSFIDLAPAGDADSEPEQAAPDTEGVILPFTLAVSKLLLENIRLYLVDEAGPAAFIEVRGLRVDGRWKGGEGKFHILSLRAGFPQQGIDIQEMTAGASLVNGRVWKLEDADIRTDRGNLRISTAAFDQYSLSGDATLRVDTETSLLADLAAFPTPAPISGDLHVRVDAVERYSAKGALSFGEAAISLDAAARIDDGVEATSHFLVSNVSTSLIGLPINGRLGASGDLRATVSERDGLHLHGSVRCDGCTLETVGDIAVTAEGDLSQSGAEVHTEVHGKGTHVIANASIQGDNGLTADAALSADVSVDIASLTTLRGIVPVKRLAGSLFARGKCHGTIRTPRCAVSADGKALSSDTVSIGTLSAKGNVGYKAEAVTLSAEATLKKIAFQELALTSASVRLAKQGPRYTIAMDAVENRRRRAAVAVKLTPGDTTAIRIEKLDSTLRGIPVTLARPATLTVAEDRLRLGGEGIELTLGQGRLHVNGAVSDKRISRARIEATALDLGMLSAFVPDPPIRGIVDAVVEADGPRRRPTISADIDAKRFSMFDLPPRDVTVDASLTPNDLDFDISVREKGAVLAAAAGTAPLRLDLHRFTVGWAKDRSADIDWRVVGLTDNDIVPFVELPEGVRFNVSGDGVLNYGAIDAFRISGKVDGGVTVPHLGRADVHATLDVAPTSQVIDVSVSGLKALSTKGEIRAALSVPRLLEKKFVMAPSHVDLTVGDAKVTAEGHWGDTGDGALSFGVENVDLDILDTYLKDIDVGGLVSVNGTVTGSPDAPTMTLSVKGSGLGYQDYTLDDWSADATWQSGRLRVETDYRQQGRPAFDAVLDIPVDFDVDTLTPRWREEAAHQIQWTIDGVDLARINPMFHHSAAGFSKIESRGQFSGTVRDLHGDAEIHTAVLYSGQNQIPVNASLEIEGCAQRLTVNAFKNKVHVVDGRIESQARLERLITEKNAFDTVPLIADIDIRGIDLTWLNVFDIAPFYDLTGKAEATLKWRGTLEHPDINGSLSLTDGEVSVGSLTDPLTDITAKVTFDNDQWSVRELSMRSAEGGLSLAMNGNIGEQGQMAFSVAAKARKFKVAMAGLPTFTLDTDTRGTLRFTKKRVDVSVRLDNTVINHVGTQQAGVKQIPKNDNTRVIDVKEDPRHTAEKKADGRDLHLRVLTEAPLRVHGASLDTYWNANINAVIRGEKTLIDGEAKIEKGSFSLFANDFTIEEASAYFTEAGGVEPHISLLATSELPEAKVYVRIDGTVTNPRLNVYSEPAMSQEAIFALLVSGSDDEAVSGSSVIAGVVQMKYPVVTNLLYNKFNLDRVSIGSSASGSGTVVKLGQRISDKLFLYTAFNLSADTDENDYEVIFEYSITERFTLDTNAGNETSGMSLSWRVPIGRSRQKSVPAPKDTSEP